MNKAWLSIIGVTEDGLEGLTSASRAALDAAKVIIGGPRHLALVGAASRGQAWPVPFDIAPVLALRGQAVAVLASGDPFWHGAGGSLTQSLSQGEWRAFPAPSVFSLAAAHLGWRLEDTRCLGLHAAPLASLRAHLQPSARLIVTLRDAAAARALFEFLVASGHPKTRLWIMDLLGGPHQNIRTCLAHEAPPPDINALVTVALLMPGTGPFLALAPGRSDADFTHDGQITKSPVRAVTLSALAPKANELLWDLGAGSGSISVEWCLAGGRAIAVEAREDRLANIQQNIADFGLSARMTAVHGQLPDAVEPLPPPDAIFIGGGCSQALMQRLVALPKGTRLVVNTVTLETESLVSALQARYGGTLMRMDFATAEPLGRYRGWQTMRPVVQWSVTL